MDRSHQQDADDQHARMKSSVLTLLHKLLERVETEQLYGEFSVTFSAQKGRIGHCEESTRRTIK